MCASHPPRCDARRGGKRTSASHLDNHRSRSTEPHVALQDPRLARRAVTARGDVVEPAASSWVLDCKT